MSGPTKAERMAEACAEYALIVARAWAEFCLTVLRDYWAPAREEARP